MNQLVEATLADLIERIENGSGPWLQEWVGGGSPTNFVTKARYHGTNILLLWSARHEHAYTTNKWATYKQWAAAGYQVKKGERSHIIFINKDTVKKGGNPDNPDDHYRLLKCAFVFNTDQLAAPPPAEAAGARTEAEKNDECELTIAATGAVVVTADSPYYIPGSDMIAVPPIESFISDSAYYVTAFHELVHWTGHTTRLDRSNLILDYAFEEVIAELGGAFLCAEHGITDITESSSKYLRGWLGKLHVDKSTALMRAAAAASKAAEFIMDFRAAQQRAA